MPQNAKRPCFYHANNGTNIEAASSSSFSRRGIHEQRVDTWSLIELAARESVASLELTRWMDNHAGEAIPHWVCPSCAAVESSTTEPPSSGSSSSSRSPTQLGEHLRLYRLKRDRLRAELQSIYQLAIERTSNQFDPSTHANPAEPIYSRDGDYPVESMWNYSSCPLRTRRPHQAAMAETSLHSTALLNTILGINPPYWSIPRYRQLLTHSTRRKHRHGGPHTSSHRPQWPFDGSRQCGSKRRQCVRCNKAILLMGQRHPWLDQPSPAVKDHLCPACSTDARECKMIYTW